MSSFNHRKAKHTNFGFIPGISLKLLVFLTVLLAACQQGGRVKVLKLAHSLNTSHPVHGGMEYMADRLEEKSNGKLKIKIYPNGQLGGEREAVELLQIGSLAMTKVSAAVMENFAPSYKVLGLPYIFRDKQHAFDFYDSKVGKEILAQGEDFRLRGLCFYDAGSRSFYTKDKPINEPSDLNGLKIRVMKSKTSINMVKLLGGSPTPISFGELYTSLQQGVIDGAENNAPSFFSAKHYEVCKYYSIDEHSSVPDVLLIGTGVWERLNDQEKQWLQEAADESSVHQRKLWKKSEEECLKAIKEAGVEISYPDKSPFASKVRPLYEEYEREPAIKELIQKIKSL
ncbi:TRAP transporter substrate-binding protein [Fulvivirgaceae bacterium BMA10]|uniref:TRAP transporter substrate-binding protein n=1 Tax=Splendidivirga corallicola TaxID=3051826 RepID=A0ABT8KWC7_9BACT|nr:TRAP transporter substrate-binding protein [Fulvivirgaceae bacterium BMA10]